LSAQNKTDPNGWVQEKWFVGEDNERQKRPLAVISFTRVDYFLLVGHDELLMKDFDIAFGISQAQLVCLVISSSRNTMYHSEFYRLSHRTDRIKVNAAPLFPSRNKQ
jgi:hypothetical protein